MFDAELGLKHRSQIAKAVDQTDVAGFDAGPDVAVRQARLLKHKAIAPTSGDGVDKVCTYLGQETVDFAGVCLSQRCERV